MTVSSSSITNIATRLTARIPGSSAVLDNFVIDRLSRKFPTATPSHLTRLRATLVSNSALGYLALKFLGLHRYIMHATPLLDQHFKRALEEAESLIHDNFVEEVWLFDPPKPAADALEGIIGSIFVDSGYRVELVFEVLDRVFEKMFQLLPRKESAPRDPTSRLRLYLQQRSCTHLEIKWVIRSTANCWSLLIFLLYLQICSTP